MPATDSKIANGSGAIIVSLAPDYPAGFRTKIWPAPWT